MRYIILLIGYALTSLKRIINYFIKAYKRNKFYRIGNNVYIGDYCTFTEKNIVIGDDVYIGKGCCFQSMHGKIEIGNHVMIGPSVHIHGGNHEFDRVGVYMKEIDSKKVGEDGVVTIEDDCWIGACTIILKGVRIGRGSIIGAGSIVTINVPPYTIYTGVPTLKMRKRWDETSIAVHEKIIKERTLSKEK